MTKANVGDNRKRRANRERAQPAPSNGAPVEAAERGHDAMRVAIEARARQIVLGAVAPIPASGRGFEAEVRRRLKQATAAARDQWQGCLAGRVMAAFTPPDDRPAMWGAIQRVRAVHRSYLAAICAPSPYAAGMRIELRPDPFGTDGVEVDGDWDDRTDEERVKDAAAAMMHLEGVLGRAGSGVLAEVKAVVLRDESSRRPDRLIVGLRAVAAEA